MRYALRGFNCSEFIHQFFELLYVFLHLCCNLLPIYVIIRINWPIFVFIVIIMIIITIIIIL